MSSYGTENIGTGAYTDRDIDLVSHDGLYSSTCELMRRHSRTRRVLDLGCSDGVGTYGLPSDFDALGIDFDPASVRLANEIGERRRRSGEGPGYAAVEASLLDLPASLRGRISAGGYDCVSALDVLEHFTRPDAVRIMREVGALVAQPHTFIVSMPIISPWSMETHREALRALRNRQRPPSGLLDRTHLILRGRGAHRRMFRDGGYEVVEEFQTDHIIGTTGDWEWQQDGRATSQLRAEAARRLREDHTLAARLTQVYAASYRWGITRRVAEAVFAYQGLYVLRPRASART